MSVALRNLPSDVLGFLFGKAGVDVPPRPGRLDLIIDDWKGTWAHTSDDPDPQARWTAAPGGQLSTLTPRII